MKTATPKKKSQCQQLLSYLRKNKSGVTTREAFIKLEIFRLSERIREIERGVPIQGGWHFPKITRTRETAPNGSTVTRYKLAR